MEDNNGRNSNRPQGLNLRPQLAPAGRRGVGALGALRIVSHERIMLRGSLACEANPGRCSIPAVRRSIAATRRAGDRKSSREGCDQRHRSKRA